MCGTDGMTDESLKAELCSRRSDCAVNVVCWQQQQQQSRLQRSGCVVFWMFLLDVFVLTSWQILDPLRRVVLQHDLESDPADPDVKVRLSSEHCSSTNMELWLTAVYGYKVPLLGLGCFMAWNIWTVQDDHPAVGSKHLALSMFAVTVFSVSGVSASLLTSNNPPVQFCLSSILILCCNICTLSWLFGPKFLCTWPKSSELQSEAAEDEDDNKDEDEDQVNSLNQQLKSQSAQLDAEIEAINRELSAESAGPDPKLHHRTGERHHDLSGAELTRLYNSPVYEAERMKRPKGSSSSIAGPFSHSGVRVTLGDGSRWLIHKGKNYGTSFQTVVTSAEHMSSEWRGVKVGNFQGRKTVSDFVETGGSNYNFLFDNCHWASIRMMDQ